MIFDAFLRELAVALPTTDLAPLEAVLRNIALEPDDLAVTLFGPVTWAVRQTQYPPVARLAYLHHLFVTATEPPQTLH
jgi:hypothetical protein